MRVAWVDREARKGTGSSDHAPVIVDLDDAPDGDIGSVVPSPFALRDQHLVLYTAPPGSHAAEALALLNVRGAESVNASGTL